MIVQRKAGEGPPARAPEDDESSPESADLELPSGAVARRPAGRTDRDGRPESGRGSDPTALRSLLGTLAYLVFWALGGLVLRVWFGLHAVDRPHSKGPLILAANHTSFLDPVVLGACSLRRVVFVMTAVFYRMRWFGWFFRWMDTIPVEEGKPNRAMLLRALRALEQGHIVAIFPEGGISLDGTLQPGKAGVASLILRAGVPVVPVSIQGTFAALSRHARFPKPATVRVRFGSPMRPETFARRRGEDRRTALKRITEEVMEQIAKLAPDAR